MRKVIYLILSVALISACKKGESACEKPNELEGFRDLQYSYNPAQPIAIDVLTERLYNSDHEDDLFSFTTPDIFINPKGNQYQTDVVSEPEYIYTLKDVNNYPDSVLIEVYAFSDCGKSNSLSTYIRFN